MSRGPCQFRNYAAFSESGIALGGIIHTYSPNDSFATVQLIDDSDPPNATNFNTGPEALADRTQYLYNRLQRGYTSVVDLQANAPTIDGDVVLVRGYGWFQYSASSSDWPDGLFVAKPNSVNIVNPGRWLYIDYAQQGARIVKRDSQYFLGGPTALLGATKNAPDPAARNGGNVGVRVCQTAGNFSIVAGDILEVHYCVLLQLAATKATDAVVGVSIHTSAAFLTESVDRRAQHTGSQPNASALANGTSSNIVIAYSRSFQHVVTNGELINLPENSPLDLVIAYDQETDGSLLQSSFLQVTHWRGGVL